MGRTKEYFYDEHLTDWLETAECKMCGEPIDRIIKYDLIYQLQS